MKKQKRPHRSTKFYFAILVMAEVAAAVIFASIITSLLEQYYDFSEAWIASAFNYFCITAEFKTLQNYINMACLIFVPL